MRTRAYRRNEREKHIKRKENIMRKYQLDSRPAIYDTKDYFWFTSPLFLDKGNKKYFTVDRGMSDCLFFCLIKYRGMLNKGKIHCSCALCSAKTRNKGKRRKLGKNYAPSINWKHTDIQKIESMKEKEALYNNNDDETKLFNADNDVEYDISKEELLELISLIPN